MFWGGSAGEGLILAPNAPVVDAAHRHGVPVLGNVFLPPVAYGGQLQWTRDLVQRDATGHYPLAAQLVAVAAAYGFDGWFVNAETGGGNTALGTAMLGFVMELKALAAARGQRVTWYDAMTVNGTVSWQGALTSQNQAFFQAADTMFVDFRWSAATLASSGTKADRLGAQPLRTVGRRRRRVERIRYVRELGRDRAGRQAAPHLDRLLPAGVDPQPPARRPARPPRTSTRPTTGSGPGGRWTRRGPTRVIRGARRRCRWRTGRRVTSVPFASVFNTGHGLRWYEEGAVVSEAPWNHLGLRDRLPSRRWVVRTAGERPAVSFDFADAWRGGSSVLVAGELDQPVVVDVYATRLPIGVNTVVDLTFRGEAGEVDVELAVATAEPSAPGATPPYTYRAVNSVNDGMRVRSVNDGTRVRSVNGWQTVTVPLTGLSGTVRALGVRLTATAGPVPLAAGRPRRPPRRHPDGPRRPLRRPRHRRERR